MQWEQFTQCHFCLTLEVQATPPDLTGGATDPAPQWKKVGEFTDIL